MIPVRVLFAAMACAGCLRAEAQASEQQPLEEIVVTSERRAFQSRAVPASLGAIPADRIAAIGAQHPFELFTRVPGVWLSRGIEQESLPAIRSPVLVGAGACLLTPELTLAVAASYAKHVYDFDRVAAQGETFVAGRDVDTAPRWLASAELDYAALPWLRLSLQWNLIGEYWVDAENAHDYPGHAVWNARVSVLPSAAWAINLRLNNVSDVRCADRADYAFGDYRYFPGHGRELFVELRYLGGAG